MFELNLDGIKTGDKVAVIRPDGTTGSVITLGEFSENHGKFRLLNKEGRAIGLLPADGFGFYAMHSKTNGPHFYYSANPEHIALAEKTIDRRNMAAIVKAESERKKLKELSDKIAKLLQEYGASIEAVQDSGDDCGVEMSVHLSVGSKSVVLN